MRYKIELLKNTFCLILLVSMFSCNLEDLFGICGKDEKVGELNLKKKSYEFFYDNWKDEIIFKNEEGKKRKFYLLENSEEEGRAAQYYTCEGDGGTASFAYYTYNSRLVKYGDGNKEIVIQLLIESPIFGYMPIPDPIVMDVFLIRGEFGNRWLSPMTHITAYRGNKDEIDRIDSYERQHVDNSKHFSDTTILGQRFNDVFGHKESCDNCTYYSTNQGIVAFKEDGETWVLAPD